MRATAGRLMVACMLLAADCMAAVNSVLSKSTLLAQTRQRR